MPADFELVAESIDPPSLDVIVPATSRLFEGHFPGDPILPAVAQLLLIDLLLRRVRGPDWRSGTIERLRLLAPVGPGDRLTVRLLPDGSASRVRSTIDRDGTPISEITLHRHPLETP